MKFDALLRRAAALALLLGGLRAVQLALQDLLALLLLPHAGI